MSYSGMTKKDLKARFNENQEKLAKLQELYEQAGWAALGDTKEGKTVYSPLFQGIKSKVAEITAEQKLIVKAYNNKKEHNAGNG